jgi:hypothetical protein
MHLGRHRGALFLVVALGLGCSYPVDTFQIGDGSTAKDSATDARVDGGDGGDADDETDGAFECPKANPDLCEGVCTNIKTDNQNCGACGHKCVGTERCSTAGGTTTPRCT